MLTILHTNDIHGRVDAFTRLVSQMNTLRDTLPYPVIYLDGGDMEELSQRLSNMTKGAAMHRLLDAAGCRATVIGNASLLRYGPTVFESYAQASRLPCLMANFRFPDGTYPRGVTPTALLPIGERTLGLIGVTAPYPIYEAFGLQQLPLAETVLAAAAALREEGAAAVILLSHLGYEADLQLADSLQGVVTLIIGGHSHTLLPNGEQVGNVRIVQAGNYAEHLGRVDLRWEGETLRVVEMRAIPIDENTPPDPDMLAVIEQIEAELAADLNAVIGHLDKPLSLAEDQPCGMGDLLAAALRDFHRADFGLGVIGHAFTAGLAAGDLTRHTLFEITNSSANPGVVEMTGAQLIECMQNGRDIERAAERPHNLRGRARGLMHLSGGQWRDGMIWVDGQPIDLGRMYRVGGSDYELEPPFSYTKEEWGLRPHYDYGFIIRDVLDWYFGQQ